MIEGQVVVVEEMKGNECRNDLAINYSDGEEAQMN